MIYLDEKFSFEGPSCYVPYSPNEVVGESVWNYFLEAQNGNVIAEVYGVPTAEARVLFTLEQDGAHFHPFEV
jgi:hypothetical protein